MFADATLPVVCATLGGYAIVSYVLTKFPVFHLSKKLKINATHISHRGGAGENVENTLTAFKHALAVKSDMLELDVHLTKDSKVVVSHDHVLKRQCGIDKPIEDIAYASLPKLKPSLVLGSQHKANTDDLQIPLLEDVFEAFPSIPICIDLKHDNTDLIAHVHELISKYDRKDITVWGSFRKSTCSACYKYDPSIALYFSARDVLTTLVLFYTGLLPFFPLQGRFFAVMMPSAFAKLFKNVHKLQQHHRFAFWVAEKLLMRPLLFEHLRKRGIYVYLWVINEECDFEKAFQYHVDGIMTDYPAKLSKFLGRQQTLGHVLPDED